MALLVEQQVGRLDIPVYQTPGVGVGQGGGDVKAKSGGLGNGELVTAVQ
jgi:hypothetical protein